MMKFLFDILDYSLFMYEFVNFVERCKLSELNSEGVLLFELSSIDFLYLLILFFAFVCIIY